MSTAHPVDAEPISGWRKWLRLRLAAIFVVTTFVSLLGWCSAWLPWWAELFSHFPVQGALGALVLTCAFMIVRAWRWTCLAAALALIHACLVLPVWMPEGAITRPPTWCLVFANVLTSNVQRDALSHVLIESQADIIGLAEIDQSWLNGILPTVPEYRVVCSAVRDDNFGIALLARRGMQVEAEIRESGPFELPIIEAHVGLGDNALHILVVHPPPPVSHDYAQARDAMLGEVATWSRAQSGSVVVLGDLNCTPWSPVFRRLLREGNLRDSRRGVGNCASWPSSFAWLGIPLDHALTRAQTSGRRVLPPIGSDHLPIALEVSVPSGLQKQGP